MSGSDVSSFSIEPGSQLGGERFILIGTGDSPATLFYKASYRVSKSHFAQSPSGGTVRASLSVHARSFVPPRSELKENFVDELLEVEDVGGVVIPAKTQLVVHATGVLQEAKGNLSFAASILHSGDSPEVAPQIGPKVQINNTTWQIVVNSGSRPRKLKLYAEGIAEKSGDKPSADFKVSIGTAGQQFKVFEQNQYGQGVATIPWDYGTINVGAYTEIVLVGYLDGSDVHNKRVNFSLQWRDII